MKIGIMQPYFMPYIGYFQLINAVDEFVVYDNIEYTKKGWINRNRILVNGKDEFITLSLKKDSDYLAIVERSLSDSFDEDRVKMLRKVKENYRKAPNFEEGYTLFETILSYEDRNLFRFILHSIQSVCAYLEIITPLVVSSTIDANHNLKGEDKVISYCQARGATQYINPIGGLELYSRERFREAGLELKFLKSQLVDYPQFNHELLPWLSILDVIMFNKQAVVKEKINREYSLISN